MSDGYVFSLKKVLRWLSLAALTTVRARTETTGGSTTQADRISGMLFAGILSGRILCLPDTPLDSLRGMYFSSVLRVMEKISVNVGFEDS